MQKKHAQFMHALQRLQSRIRCGLIGKGDDVGAGTGGRFLFKWGRAGDDRVAVGAVELAVAPFKADEPSLVVVAARAEGPKVNFLRLEPVQTAAPEQVGRKPHGFFHGFKAGLQEMKLVVQGYAARLQFHEQPASLFVPARGEEIVDFFKKAIVQHGLLPYCCSISEPGSISLGGWNPPLARGENFYPYF